MKYSSRSSALLSTLSGKARLTSCFGRRAFRFIVTLALTFSLAAGALPNPQRAAARQASVTAEATANLLPQSSTKTSAEIEQRARESYGRLGISFEENRGQVDEQVRFLSRHGGATLFLTNDAASFVLSAPVQSSTGAIESPDSARGDVPGERPIEDEQMPAERARGEATNKGLRLHTLRMKFEGANPRAEVVGERELEGRVNYFLGNDPSRWQTDVKTYGAVRYRGIYEGVDLVYYGNERGEMEYDFEVAPGANPNQISLQIEGAQALEVDAAGDMVMTTPAGEMRQHKPVVYQEVDGTRREVESGFAVGGDGRVRFSLGEYDTSAPLIIDPVLVYSTYLGGGAVDSGRSIAVDSAGNAYLTGTTLSIDFPTANAFQSIRGSYDDAFVTKLNAAGTAFVYSTYLGGNNQDFGRGITVDSSGNAYVAGRTFSTNFPIVNPIQATLGGGDDVFVTKLNAAGAALFYSTYLGGSISDVGSGIAVDSAGNAYVVGETASTNFPLANALQSTPGGSSDAFVAKLNAGGTALVYSTYLGGSSIDYGRGIRVDSAGNAYVAGRTFSTNFPTANAIQSTLSGTFDVFVSKLNAAGSAFVYSTYLGGSGGDSGDGIAVDSAGNAYLTGETTSNNFPTANALQSTLGGSDDAFVTKLNAAGTALVYSTYLGGSGDEEGFGIAVDSAGNAYLTGSTRSNNFPTANAIQATLGGGDDVFATKLNAAGSAFVYSTYLGGSISDVGSGIAIDSAGNAYLTGYTFSSNFPTANAIQGARGGGDTDAFVAKLGNTSPPATYSITGRVITNGSTGVIGVSGVSVKLTGSQTITKTTDASGNYSFTGLTPGGNFTVTPSKTNLSFSPPSRSFSNLSANLINVNFTVPSLSVNNLTITEANTGATTAATFTVKLSQASTETITVKYATANATALAPADYTALPLSTLTFTPGQTSKTVTVQVKGDALDEANETFKLLLSAPTKASISDGEGICTITDNDLTPNLRVNNPTITESNVTATVNFAVILSAPSGQVVTVKYATANGTAVAPADYAAKALTTLTFQPGETTKFVPVTVTGDTLDEATESFKLNLSSPVNATISAGTGTCTITDNDAASISINNVTVTEPDANTVAMTFTVKLSLASSRTVTVKYQTANGTATAPADYTAKALTTLSFSPGQTTNTVTVLVKGDVTKEPSETFFVNLSSPVNATISDNQGQGTITNDD